MPADVRQAAMAWPTPPLRTITVEAPILQQAPGVTGQAWGPQVNGGVGKSMRGMKGAVAITGSAGTPGRRGWLSSSPLPGHSEKGRKQMGSLWAESKYEGMGFRGTGQNTGWAHMPY